MEGKTMKAKTETQVAKMQRKVREMVRKTERQFKLIMRVRMANSQFRVEAR
jgi:hypothetical protein